MGNAALNLGVDFWTISCHSCGGTYALAAGYLKKRREEGGSWTCPYCEMGTVYKEPKTKRLERKLERERQRREWAEKGRERYRKEAEHQERRAAGYKGAFTKAKKRVGNGVCPCCNRSFENLRRHMATKHPDYADKEPQVEEDRTCGSTTMDGSECNRRITGSADRCWQHRD